MILIISIIINLVLIGGIIIFVIKINNFKKREINRREMLKELFELCKTYLSEIEKRDKIIQEYKDHFYNQRTKEVIFNFLESIYNSNLKIETISIETILKLKDFSQKVSGAIVNTINFFTSIVKNIEEIIKPSYKIMEEIKDKLKINESIESSESRLKNALEIVKERYDNLINNISEDLLNILKNKNKNIGVFDEIKEKLLNIVQFSNNIVDLAENIKLLAINAKIEAARAGISGKGFQVVANEVEKLSLKSSNIAKLIKENIDTTNTFITNSLKELNDQITEESKFLDNLINLLKSVFLPVIDSLVNMSNSTDHIIEEIEIIKKDFNDILFALQKEEIVIQDLGGNLSNLLQTVKDSIVNSFDNFITLAKYNNLYYSGIRKDAINEKAEIKEKEDNKECGDVIIF